MISKLLALLASVIASVGLMTSPAGAYLDYQWYDVYNYGSVNIHYHEPPNFPNTTVAFGYAPTSSPGTQFRVWMQCEDTPTGPYYFAYSIYKTQGTGNVVTSCNGGDQIRNGHPVRWNLNFGIHYL